MLDRLTLWATRHHVEHHEIAGSGTQIAEALSRGLPMAGLITIRLDWDAEPERYRVLARLNELRGRLANPRQGALVLLGPEAMAREAAIKAADLWSVRSLNRVARRPAEVVATRVPEIPSLDGPAPGRLLFADYQVADSSDAARDVLGRLRLAARLSTHDLRAARREAEAAARTTPPGSELHALCASAAAELAGLDEDWASLHRYLESALNVPHDRVSLALTSLIRQVGLRYGDLDAAEAAADRDLSVRRDLADRIGTPETLRDLSISLDNVGAVAQARGDWDRATTVYDESLTLAAEACHHDSSRSALDWLTWLRDHPPTPPAPPA
ncbi:MAG: hypothetical protein U0Q21_15450 [Dermatophilaceae bacterium]